jgi:DNA-binding winged helix-turn-helix (wHTH) protein/tetratricopeptide (TPR) repeat protein
MSLIYSFSGFILKSDEQSLYYKKNRLELGLKGFNLLLTLLDNHNKVVTKDDLIKAGWKNQIVTDGTLNKQIERIRQILTNVHPENGFIETVRGIGYKLNASVTISKVNQETRSKLKRTIVSVSILPLVLLIFFLPTWQSSNTSSDSSVMPYNVAIIPSALGSDFMNEGGISYLSTLLGKNPRIFHTTPKSDWFKHDDKNKLAIELENQNQLDFVLLLNLKEEGEFKVAHLELKNSSEFKKEEVLNARSFKQLFEDINSWVLLQLKIENTNKNDLTGDLSSDGFAVESYLRGKKESSSRNYTSAIQYFKTAIAQDPNFVLALLDLARAQIKSNDYSEAEALLTTIESTKVLTDDLKLYALTLKTSLLTNTLRSSQAKPYIDEALKLAESTKDEKLQILTLYYQGEMYKELGDIDSSINSTLKQKEILEKNSKNKTDLMRVANNLAHAYYATNQLELAKNEIQEAILWFEKINHSVGKFNSYGLLASIQYELAQYEAAYISINKAKIMLNDIEDRQLTLNVLEIIAYIELELGLHSRCRETILEIESLIPVMGTLHPKYTADILTFKLNSILDNSVLIIEESKRLDELTQELKDDYLFVRQVVLSALIEMNFKLKDYSKVELHLDDLLSITKENETSGMLFYKINYYHWKYVTGFKEQAKKELNNLLIQLINNKQNKFALNISYLLMDMDAEEGLVNTQKLLNQIKYINPFAYPYLKYQAKIAANQDKYFEASRLMQEMKNESNEWWNVDDQMLLESYLSKTK